MTRGKAWERVSPYVLAIATGSLYCWAWSPWHPVTDGFRDILSAVVSAAANVFGFLLAGAALLVTVRGSWYKARASEAGVYHSLIKNLFVAMRWVLYTMVVSVVCLSFDNGWWKIPSHRYFVAIWIFVVMSGLGLVMRALRILTKLFLLISEE